MIDTLDKLAAVNDEPCVTLSFNTHRTFPDNDQDSIVLKNLIREAEQSLIEKHGKRETTSLVEKLNAIPDELDMNYNADSMHIFVSENTKEIIKLGWETKKNVAFVRESFVVKPLIKSMTRSADYLILLISQSGCPLYRASNDSIVEEIKNEDFPFGENKHILESHADMSKAKLVDSMLKEYLNKVDKALVKVYNEELLKCVVVSTEDNYTKLQEVADRSDIYAGHCSVNYNDIRPHTLAADAWEVMEANQKNSRTEAIEEMQEAVGQGKVITDLKEIYKASIEGRGELLITHNDFSQFARYNESDNIELVNESEAGDNDVDLADDLAWEVMSRKGRVVFTNQEEIRELGDIALKVRY